MFNRLKSKYIGDSAFYRRVMLMVVPMIVQNLITNLVSMIDNIMVGRLGTEQMTGVSIVNQFVFIFNITTFGAVSGPGIFGAQFFGKGDHEGQKQTFRFRLMICTAIIGVAALIFYSFDEQLISLFLSKEDSPAKLAATMNFGKSYIKIIILGLLPFGIGQAYSSAVRECGETRIPMLGSFCAVGVNLVLDYGLIFGKLGMPEMGVRGAAVATVISKVIEALVVMIWAHTHTHKNKYIVGVYRSLKINVGLLKDMIIKGLPLLVNEFLWAAGMSTIDHFYSRRGLDVIAARNISVTMTNLFGAVYIQMGACIAIIVGNELGANRLKQARSTDDKLRFFSVASTVIISLMVLPLAFFFPKLYNTEADIMALASFMIIVHALAMPMYAYTNACYFTIRSGGKTLLTFLFDFCFTWLFMLPIGYFLSYRSSVDIHIMYTVMTMTELVKVVIGYFLVRSDLWINNIVDDKRIEEQA